MNSDSGPATQTEKALAIALMSLAGGLFAGVLAFLPSIFSVLNDQGDRIAIWLILAVLFFLTLSLVFGGRGHAYGPGHHGFLDRFNLQATMGVIALLLISSLGIVTYFLREPSDLDVLDARLRPLIDQISALEKKVDSVEAGMGGIEGIRDDLAAIEQKLNDEIRALNDRIDELE